MKKLVCLIIFSVLILSCNRGKRYHDSESQTIEPIQEDIQIDILNDVRTFQKKMNTEFKDPSISPLLEKDKVRFTGLDFFPINTTFRVIAKFVRTPNEIPFLMPTTTGRKSKEVKYGEIHFKINEEDYKLNVYQDQDLRFGGDHKNDLFLPFRDLTNGIETYGGGRYINLKIPSGDSITVDFNKAYNPYCAYNENYSCPIVPSQNSLAVEILAGVKAFKE
ncbi:DUF1684 domain-containing protein [Flavobacteriaceae bacterium R38]|nr:DUF1684 domain-containing protein [Flavobacteriaceae bacterium R38]